MTPNSLRFTMLALSLITIRDTSLLERREQKYLLSWEMARLPSQ